MRLVVVTAACLVAMLGAAAPTAQAQAVQLPTCRQFSIGTSVLVPDRGGIYLGGVDRAAYGSSRRGPLNRSSASSVGTSGVSVHATIIDHAELDRAVLAEAAARRGAQADVLGRDIRTGELRRSGYSPVERERNQAKPTAADAIRRKAAFLSRHTAKNGSR